MDDQPGPGRAGTASDYAFLATVAAGEPVLDHVDGLGAALVITATRAIVVRQGAHFRPRNGVREWPLSGIRDVHVAQPRHGNGRVVLRTGPYPWQAVSLFVGAGQWPAAERVVAQIRARVAHARRSASPELSPDRDSLASKPQDRD